MGVQIRIGKASKRGEEYCSLLLERDDDLAL